MEGKTIHLRTLDEMDRQQPAFSLTITPDLISWVECKLKTQHGGFRYTRLNGDKNKRIHN